MTVDELEKRIFEVEEFRVVVRAPHSDKVGDYDFKRKADRGGSLTNWCRSRLEPLINGHEYIVLDGVCGVPHGRTKLETLRASYER